MNKSGWSTSGSFWKTNGKSENFCWWKELLTRHGVLGYVHWLLGLVPDNIQ